MARISTHEARLAGNTLNVDWEKTDFQEFKLGLEEELEHGSRNPKTDVTQDDLIKTGKIALAHLDEDPKYYTKLKATFKEGSFDGPAPISIKTFDDKTLGLITKSLNLDLEKVLPNELRRGVVEELGKMEVYTTAALNSEKLTRAVVESYSNLLEEPNFYSRPKADSFAHVLSGGQLGEPNVRFEELVRLTVRQEMLEEGFLDALKRLKSAPEQVWNKAKAALQKAVSTGTGVLNKLTNKFAAAKSKLLPFVQLIKSTEAEVGEKFPIDQNLKIAMGLSKKAQAAQAELSGEVKEIQQAQKAAPGQVAAQESYARGVTSILNETFVSKQQKPLNEALTPITIVGFILAAVGGTTMLFKGLYKLANKYGLKRTAEAFQHAHHVAHAIEEKTVDYMIPDRLSYGVYSKLWKKGFKLKSQQDKALSFEEYSQNLNGSRHQVEGLIYKLLLSYLLVNGAIGIVKAGVSLLGAAESAAVTVKAVEIATGVGSAVDIFEPMA